jgi:phosphoribosyl 1,2-cyclic phosphate phosphodiesterase
MTTETSNYIQFLGTGAGDFFEAHQQSCGEGYCAEAVALGGRNIRHASSLFVAPGILIDFYSAGQLAALGHENGSIRHLLITHGHFDHFMPAEVHEFAQGMERPLKVYGNATVRDSLDFVTAHRWDDAAKRFRRSRCATNIEITCVGPSDSFRVGDVKVTAVQANHMIEKRRMILEQQALNYVIEREDKALFYGVDSSYTLPGTMEMLCGFKFDILVFDATFGSREIDPLTSGHHNFPMLDETLSEFCQAGLLQRDAVVVAQHISLHEVPPHDRIAASLADKGIVLAWDGMKLAF